MGQYVLLLVVALTVGAVVFGVTVLVSGGDPGLEAVEPDGRAIPLPATRPLVETDIATVRFDTAIRGYRMAQVDRALQRAAYDIGYKDELIGVLEAEVAALREGRTGDAEVLRQAREAAQVSDPDAEERDVDEAGPAAEPAPVVAASGPGPVVAAASEPAPPDTPGETAPEITAEAAPVDAGDVAAHDTVHGNTDADTAGAGTAGTEVPAEDEPVDATRADPDAPAAAEDATDVPVDAPGGASGNGAAPVDTPAAGMPAAGEATRHPDDADEADQPTAQAGGATGQPHAATADRR